MRRRDEGREHALRDLHEVYTQIDQLLAPFSCANSATCCRFAETGRQPYVTQLELEALGKPPPQAQPRRLPLLGDCPLLDASGRCSRYAVRPFGCRTYFCEQREGPRRFPRDEVNRLARTLQDLSLRHYPESRETRPLTRALKR